MASPSEVRALFEARLNESPPAEFHPLDLERVNDDAYLNRILQHHDNDVQASANMLWDTLVWRKTINANDLNENTLRMDYVKDGTFFPHGRDVDGSLLLIIKSKNHIKGEKDMEEIKKIIVYWFDRIERQENGKKISIFFDMDGCGLSNMDMELIKYLINVLKLYYPYFLNYIIIYQMPWVLSAGFKIVKTLLPGKAVEKMKFVTKDTLKELVAPNQALTCWGGLDEYVFEFVPEGKSEQSTPKKVTFAEQGDNTHSPGEMLKLTPNDAIVFKTENDDLVGQLIIQNMEEGPISFKIRTTSPEKFRVKPSAGTLAAKALQTVIITVQPGFSMKNMIRDRFLVMSVQIPKTDMSQNELAVAWQNSSGSKVDEYRLRSHFPEAPKNGNVLVLDEKNQEKGDLVTNTLNNLKINYDMINGQIQILKIYQLITLFMTVVAVFLGYLVYKNSTVSDGYCESLGRANIPDRDIADM